MGSHFTQANYRLCTKCSNFVRDDGKPKDGLSRERGSLPKGIKEEHYCKLITDTNLSVHWNYSYWFHNLIARRVRNSTVIDMEFFVPEYCPYTLEHQMVNPTVEIVKPKK